MHIRLSQRQWHLRTARVMKPTARHSDRKKQSIPQTNISYISNVPVHSDKTFSLKTFSSCATILLRGKCFEILSRKTVCNQCLLNEGARSNTSLGLKPSQVLNTADSCAMVKPLSSFHDSSVILKNGLFTNNSWICILSSWICFIRFSWWWVSINSP